MTSLFAWLHNTFHITSSAFRFEEVHTPFYSCTLGSEYDSISLRVRVKENLLQVIKGLLELGNLFETFMLLEDFV